MYIFYVVSIRVCRPQADRVVSIDPLDRKMPGNGYTAKVRVREKYHIVGFISSGTYGRVYKAEAKDRELYAQSTDGTYPHRELCAIKKWVRRQIQSYLLMS
jgi:hypothetical protein